MKSLPLIILVVALAVGFFLNKTPNKDAKVMIEDKVESSMAAPVRDSAVGTQTAAPTNPDLPL